MRSIRRCWRVPAMFAALLASVAAALPVAAADGDDEPSIRFVRPRHLMTVLGPSEIRFVIDVPAGGTVESLTVSVDDVPIGTMRRPPWVMPWNAGDGTQPHRLTATLRLTDGRTASDAVSTSALQVNQIERVDLVNLYMIVRNPGGGYVTGLTSDDFRVREDGVEQRVERFSTSDKPLRVAIVLDTSGSMERGGKIQRAQTAALQFLDILDADDEGLVVTFADRVDVAQDLTRDRSELATAIRGARAEGGTALYDAIYRASRKLNDFDGRRVIVLLSDGEDMAANGLEPGSLHTLDEALEQALRDEVMVFVVGLGRDLDRRYVRRWGPLYGISNVDPDVSLRDVLHRIADSTGGRLILARRSGKLDAAFKTVADDLGHQYTLAYQSSNTTEDGRWREVRIDVPTQGDVEVVTRRGYYAPKPARGSGRGPR